MMATMIVMTMMMCMLLLSGHHSQSVLLSGHHSQSGWPARRESEVFKLLRLLEVTAIDLLFCKHSSYVCNELHCIAMHCL